MEYNIIMNLETKKKYIKEYMAEGVNLSNAIKMVYCTDEDIEEIEADKDFINEVEEIQLTTVASTLRNYNLTVKG